MTDLERKNLRRAMYSREAVRTEEDEEGERANDVITSGGVSGANKTAARFPSKCVHLLKATKG